MEESLDQLYELLPVIYRQQDVEQNYSLRALLQVITEQAKLVEANMDQLYQNWFIETCEDWVVPYIGDLVGYRTVHEAGEPGEVTTPEGQERNKILIPRREVANTLRYRRRKGTLALLELLANDVAGWPARAVEFYELLGWTQAMNHVRAGRGQTVDMRRVNILELLNTPFDELAHTVDVRRISAELEPGRYNIPSVGLFVWRLKTYPVTEGDAYLLEPPPENREGSNCFTFSLLGNDCPLYARALPETDPTQIATEANLPAPIRRQAFADDPGRFYGQDKSLFIWKVFDPGSGGPVEVREVPSGQIIPANLEDWRYTPKGEDVAVDPELGRMIFDPEPKFCPTSVRVSYRYGFSADMGGGEYKRTIHPVESAPQVNQPVYYRVGEKQALKSIEEALESWNKDKARPSYAVVEIVDSREYSAALNDLVLLKGQSLQIRAANGAHPLIYLADRSKSRLDALKLSKKSTGGRLTLDGLLIFGRGISVAGELDELNIRHCTLVPGWEIFRYAFRLKRGGTGPSIELYSRTARLRIEHSIVGSIQIYQHEPHADPVRVFISDSILDATSADREALGGRKDTLAHAVLTIKRCTVIGQVQVHSMRLAENCIFDGKVRVGRRQGGCMRFCYIAPHPERRLPRRYHCQPELAEQVKKEEIEVRRADIEASGLDPVKKARQLAMLPTIESAQHMEQERVRPVFNSTQYGTPTYCQLADSCAEEIKRGADDESEMGAFHHLYQPQRAANLRTRLSEYTPAEMDIGIIYAS
jgi:hypothetical protein